MPTTSEDQSPAEWIGAGLFLAYAVMLFAHRDSPSMTDYADWTYQGALLTRHLLGQADPAHGLKPYPVPNSAATFGVGLLALALPWAVAAKVWLCAQMAFCWFTLRELARAAGARAGVWIVAPQALFLGVNWWYGFINFQLGIAWVLLLAAMLLRRSRGEAWSDWKLGSVLVCAFFTHMIPFAFCGLLVMLYAVQTARWKALWQIVPAGLLSAWYVIGRYLVAGDADGQAGMISPVRNYSAAFWAYKANSFAKSFGFVNPGEMTGSVALAMLGKIVFVALFAVNGLLCLLAGWLILRALIRHVHRGEPERFVWIAIVVFVPLYLLAPGTALGVSDPGSRLLQTALAPALVLALRGRGLLQTVVACCASGLAVAAVLLFVRAGFGTELPLADTGLPHAIVEFAHVPNHDQDGFYIALGRGDYSLQVFPTGMLLNRR